MPRDEATTIYSSDEEDVDDGAGPSSLRPRTSSAASKTKVKESLGDETGMGEEQSTVRQRTSSAVSQSKAQDGPVEAGSPASSDGADAEKQGRKHRGPNPTVNYKSHFLRYKKQFDMLSAESTTKKAELKRASLKQLKLTDELDFLVDAIAGELHRRDQIKHGKIDPETGLVFNATQKAPVRERELASADGPGEGYTTRLTGQASVEDDELLALAEADAASTATEDLIVETPNRTRKTTGEKMPRTSMKRQRSASANTGGGTDDELLEAAGLTTPASKRARNE